MGLLVDLVVAVVGDVLAEPLLAAALQPDHGGAALEAARDGLAVPFERVAVDLEGQVGDALVGAHGAQGYPGLPLASRSGMLEALGFFALMEAAGLAAAPLAALVLGRLPGAGLGFAKVLGVLLVGWLVWMAGQHRARGLRPGDDRRRVRARRRARRARRVAAAPGRGAAALRCGGAAARAVRPLAPRPARRAGAARRGPRAAAAVARLRGRVRGRVRRDGAADGLRARRLEHREADGRDADDGDRGVGQLPAAGRVDGGGDGQLLLPRPPAAGAARPRALARAERRLQPRGRRAVRAVRLGGLHARGDAVGGGAGARRARRRRARRRRAGGRRARARARQPRGRARVAARGRAARRLRLVRRLARDPGHDQRVPRVLLHARRPARARAGDPVHAARLGVRAAGRARRPARGPRAARGGRGAHRRARGRRALRDQLVVVSGHGGAAGRRRRGLDAQPGGARAAAVRRGLDGARAARRRRARAAVLAGLRPGGARHRLGRRAPLVQRLGGRHGADLRRARLGAGRRLRGPAAGGAAARADRGVGRGRRRVRALAARAGRSRRRRAAARRARRRAARRAHGPARGARALPLAAHRGRGGVRARARARLRARRVRQRRAVPDEHGLQARLPGVPAARGGRGLRAAVGRPLAAAPGLGGMGGGRRGPAPARARVPLRRQLGPPRRLHGRARRSTGSAGCARAPPATSGRSSGCGRTRRATPSCSRPPAPTTPASATRACPPSRAARP